jgi:hypothetical protein
MPYQRAPLSEIIFRLTVYGILLAATAAFWLAVIALVTGNASGQTPAIYVPFRWQVDTARPARQDIAITHGETISIEPTYITYGQPVDLSQCYEVLLRYRSADMAADAYYAATGTVTSATNGTVSIIFGPAQTGTNSLYTYDIKLTGADSASLKASGRIKVTAGIGTTLTPISGTVTGRIDFANIEVDNPDSAPFANSGDLLAIDNRLDGHDQDILDLTDLVGDGVAGVTSSLQAHIQSQAGVDAGQDAQIQLALESANMGNDISGVSTNATVIATHGRLFPPANETPADMQAMVWDTVLNRMKWGSVDLTSIWTAINNLIANAVTQTYVDSEVSRIEGMVDGNDHVLRLTEEFEAADWLEIASGVWQHNTYGWLASAAIVISGELRLLPDIGTITIDTTNHVSRVALTGTASPYLVAHAQTLSGPWTSYDPVKDNIALTNRFAIRIINTGGSQVTVSRLDLYSWTHPERVGSIRDFSGLTLRVDTPTGSDSREAANVSYVRNLPATGSISGTFASGFSVDKFKTVPLSIAGLLNGMGMVYYSSVNEFRPVDVATQFELEAAVAPLATIAALNTLTDRVSATEAGTSVQFEGEVAGPAASNRVVKLLGANLPTGPAPAQHSLVMGAGGTWELKSVLASNIVYAAGTNAIESVPANSAAFYRADYNGTIVGVFVLDQQVVCWFNGDGWTIPHGNLTLYEQLLESNIHLLDGSLVEPALAFASETGMGWHRASSGGEHVWRFGKANNAVLDIGGTGLRMAAGKTVTLADGSRAVSLAEVTGGITLAENDPLSIHQSTTEVAWTNAGGTYTTAQIIATSPALSNGVASVTYDLSGAMQAVVEMSDLAQTNWVAFTPFATPGYIRISLSDAVPPPGELDTTISNIIAASWTRPDLYGEIADTAGQIIHVDPATQPRQPAQLAQLETAVAAVTPATWSLYPALGPVRADKVIVGNGWSIHELEGGLSFLSFADALTTTNGLTIANNGSAALTFTPGLAGLHIAAVVLDGSNATINVSTNGVDSEPFIRWTSDIMAPDWIRLDAVSSTWPDATNGVYIIEVIVPDPAAGFLSAARETGAARIDTHAPLYDLGERVATTSSVAAVEARLDTVEAWPAATFLVDGTNLLWVSGGVTNRITMEVVE